MANEKRLIDANALKNAILAEPWKDQPNMVRLTVDYINIIIDEQPTVDAVEVVHGRWVEDTATDMIACTECGHAWNIIDNCTETFNYCPSCGAKMDEERQCE